MFLLVLVDFARNIVTEAQRLSTIVLWQFPAGRAEGPERTVQPAGKVILSIRVRDAKRVRENRSKVAPVGTRRSLSPTAGPAPPVAENRTS